MPDHAAGGDEARARRALLYMLEDLQRNRDALREAWRQWRNAVDSLDVAIMVHDSQSRIVRANRAYAALAGSDCGQLVGRPYWECFPRRDGPLPECADGACAACAGGEFALDGGRIYASRACPLDVEGLGTHALHVFQDVTEERRRAEKSRLHLLRVASHSRALGIVAASQALVAGDVEALARDVTENVSCACAVPRAEVWLFDEDETELRCIDRFDALAGTHSGGERLAADRFPYGTALEAPVRYGKRRFGILRLDPAGEPRDWEEADAAFANQVAATLAIAISNPTTRETERAAPASERASLASATELKSLSSRLARSEEDVRRRVAADLHDEVGGAMTALSLNLRILRDSLPPDLEASLAGRLEDSLAMLAETTGVVRDLMAELRSPVLDDYGLAAALRWYGEQFQKRAGLEVLVASPEGDERLTVADDGAGFEPLSRSAGTHPAWGIVSMRERAAAIGGHLRVDSAPGKGTCVTVELGANP